MRAAFDYEDFALRIDEHPSGFQVRLVRSPFGPRKEPFTAPFQPTEADAFLESSHWTRVQDRGRPDYLATRDLVAASTTELCPTWSQQSVGSKLFRSLFKDTIFQCFLRSLTHVKSLLNTGLRIRLELDPSQPQFASLGALPWELMYRSESRDYLSRNLLTPVVRYLDVSHLQTAPPPILDELRILVLISTPRGAPALDHQGELKRIESAWGTRPNIHILRPERPTLRALRDLLRDATPHVLHFIGHGSFDPTTGHGSLLFEDGRGNSRPVTGSLLADTLKIGHQIRLVFLNSCEGARFPRRMGQDPYHGVASALLMGGIATVIAMQSPISDKAAVLFCDSCYSALAAGEPIESAVTEGRIAIYQEQPDSWEWATPALYMSVTHGRLFTPIRADVSEGASEETRQLEKALTLLDLKRYDKAINLFQEILVDQPGAAEAYYYLALSRFGGRAPRRQNLDIIRKAEEDIRTAVDLANDQAHFLLLWALIKEDYYSWNGLRVPPPTIEELLVAAGKTKTVKAKLRQLLHHLPTSPNPVRDHIDHALDS